MKPIHTLLIAIAAQGLVAVRAVDLPIPPPNELSKANAEWAQTAGKFYFHLEKCDSEEVLKFIHPTVFKSNMDILAGFMKHVKEHQLRNLSIKWSSTPALMRNVNADEKIDDGKVMGVFCMTQFMEAKDKPAIQEVGDGLFRNLTMPRIDLWIKDGGNWYVLPQEHVNFSALLENQASIKALTTQFR